MVFKWFLNGFLNGRGFVSLMVTSLTSTKKNDSSARKNKLSRSASSIFHFLQVVRSRGEEKPSGKLRDALARQPKYNCAVIGEGVLIRDSEGRDSATLGGNDLYDPAYLSEQLLVLFIQPTKLYCLCIALSICAKKKRRRDPVPGARGGFHIDL